MGAIVQPIRSPLVLRRCVLVLVVMIALALARTGVARAAAADPAPPGPPVAELAARQEATQDPGVQAVDPPASQRTTDDGTQLDQLIAAALLTLAGLMVILTWGYWKATTPAGRHRRR